MLRLSCLFSSSIVEENRNRKDPSRYDDIPGNTFLVRSNPRIRQFRRSHNDGSEREIDGSQTIGMALGRGGVRRCFREIRLARERPRLIALKEVVFIKVPWVSNDAARQTGAFIVNNAHIA